MKNSFLKFTLISTLSIAFYSCGGEKKAEPEATTSEAPVETSQTNQSAGKMGTASITGVITFDGKAPSMKPIDMNADPVCKAQHSEPVLSETLVLGDGNTMANILVKVKSGISGTYPVPTEPAVLDQHGCKYIPHVLGVMVGQTVKVLNSDGTLHNIHSQSKENKQFNVAMPAARKEMDQKFDKVESSFKIKCDVHPWMSCFVEVLPHPFFNVTAKDGKFTISNLPAGTYEIEAWHEKLGTQTATVTVGEGEAKSQDFTFKMAGDASGS